MIKNIFLVLIIIIIFNKVFKIEEHFGGLFGGKSDNVDDNNYSDIDLKIIKKK